MPLFAGGTSTNRGAVSAPRSRGHMRAPSAPAASRVHCRRVRNIVSYDNSSIGIGVALPHDADPVVGKRLMASRRLVLRHVAGDALLARDLAGLLADGRVPRVV